MADDLRPLTEPDLYDEDFFLWSERQARLIREHADKLAALGLDVANLQEEVGDLGRAERERTFSLCQNILIHFYKLAWTRHEEPKPHWQSEVLTWQGRLARIMAPSHRKAIEADLDSLHAQAARIAALSFQTHEPDTPTDPALRWSLPEILGETNDPLDAG